MKRWTRKLLAGLLSFGMLLQAASPLSALAAETPTVESYITVYDGFSWDHTSVTYVLNRYTNGNVSWEGGNNPWNGVDVRYDTRSNTYVFNGTLSVPAGGTGDRATLICSDPDNDSIKIDGGNGVAVNTSLQIGVSDTIRGAKNVTVLANSNSTAINGSAAFDCNGDVTITNPSGAVTSQYGGIVVYNYAKDIVITGKSEDPLIGSLFSSYSSGNITIENPNGADVRTNLSISGAAEVKLTGSDSSGLVLLRDSSLSMFKIKAKALTMENKSGPVGPVEFTRTDTTNPYRVAVGESESNNTQTALEGTTYSATVNEKYLNIKSGTSENTTVKRTLTLKYAEAYEGETKLDGTDGGNGITTYTVENGKALTIKAVAPDSVSRWTFTGWEGSSETSENITVTVNRNMTLTANWEEVTDPATDYGIKVTIGSNSPIKVTRNNCGNILGVGNDKLTYDPDTHTLTGIGRFGKLQINITTTDSVDVKLSNDAGGIVVDGSLTVDGAQNVTISGNRYDGATIGGAADISCSGTVTLENKGSDKAVSGELKYTPKHAQKYEIKTGTTAENAETFYTGESGTGYTGLFNNSYINIAPASSDDTTPDDTGTVDSGSDVGGAVAAVLVGSAAVWGGYEIATRVILHNILPEGTAIPANRGQLALLVWNNAGRPEPAAQPAFADMDDADMAKAAQWCVEQGIMEAKTAETFKPEGWTPKLKVIEVWNKAFPKQ